MKKNVMNVVLCLTPVLAFCAKSDDANRRVIETEFNLSRQFEATAVRSFQLMIDSPQGPGLGFQPSAPEEYTVGGHRFVAEVRDCDGDGENEFCVTFPNNPFAGSSFKFRFHAALPESLDVAINYVVFLEGGREERGTVTVFSDGSPLRFAQSRATVSAVIPCRIGYSCKKTAGEAPVLTGTFPNSPASSRAPRVLGTAPASMMVKLFRDDACSTEVVGVGTGADLMADGIAVNLEVPENVTSMFYARAIDGEGNESLCSNGARYTHDSVATLAPSDIAFNPAPPANNNTPRISGRAEETSTVSIFTGGCGAPTGLLVVEGSAAEFLNPGLRVPSHAVNNDETTVLYVRATDRAGNVSPCAEAHYAEDSMSPDAPTDLAFTPTPPANDNQPTLRGRAEAGSTVKVFTHFCGGNEIGTLTAEQFAADGLAIPTGVIADNASVRFYVRATDVAGNRSACAQADFIEDSAAPGAPIGLSTIPASPANNNEPVVKGASVELGSTVRVDVGTCAVAELSQVGSALVSGSAQDFTTVGLRIPAGTIADNSDVTFAVRSIDASGNVSACTEIRYVEDSTAPAVPTVSHFSPSPPANDNIPKLFGKVGEGDEDATIELFIDACGGEGRRVAWGSAEEFNKKGIQIPAGIVNNNRETTLLVRAVDLAGNASDCVSATYIEDSRAPARPAGLMFEHLAKNVLAIKPFESSDPTPILMGTVIGTSDPEADVTVRIYTVFCEGTEVTPSTGIPAKAFRTLGFTIPVGTIPLNTATRFYVLAEDRAGNRSACSTIEYLHDNKAPEVPDADDLEMYPKSPSPHPMPMIRGHVAESDARVEIWKGGCATPSALPVAIKSAREFRTRGVPVSVDTDPIYRKTTTFFVRAIDVAGNASDCAIVSYVHDGKNLSAVNPSSIAFEEGAVSSNRSPVVSGQIFLGQGDTAADKANFAVRLYRSGCNEPRGELVADVKASEFEAGIRLPRWSVKLNQVTSYSAFVYDAAKNASPCTLVTYTHDDKAPIVPAVQLVTKIPAARPQFRVGTEAGATVQIFETACGFGEAVGKATVTTGASTLVNTTLTGTVTPGTEIRLWVQATDAAGNESRCSVYNYIP